MKFTRIDANTCLNYVTAEHTAHGHKLLIKLPNEIEPNLWMEYDHGIVYSHVLVLRFSSNVAYP